MEREAGILLSVTSLPSKYGIGCFSRCAYDFVDWLHDAGQAYWQILPLGQTGYGDSPYQSFSSYAGNPYMISLEALIEDGSLNESECDKIDWGEDERRIDYEKIYKNRYRLLRTAYKRAKDKDVAEREEFETKNRVWLEDYAFFMAIKESFDGIPLDRWEKSLRMRDDEALEKKRKELDEEIGFWKFVQFLFFSQWKALKKYANDRGVRIIGDIPIYISSDSAEVWTDPALFQLDMDGVPTAVAGCPPDPFSPEGQLWGNPLYSWEEHRRTGYSWWIARLAHAFEMYDVVRIDHFRGFDSYYSIPYGASNAVGGHWEKGVGMELFEAVEHKLGKKDVIAEDLGYMTESVRKLVRDSGFAGMKILQFGFDASDGYFENEYLPHNYPPNSAAYTGTHDNPTLVSWLRSLSSDELAMVRRYTCDRHTPREEMSDVLIGMLMRSPSRICIVPMQDYLGYSDHARMNRPSTLGDNWIWRMMEEELDEKLKKKIRDLCAIGGRVVR